MPAEDLTSSVDPRKSRGNNRSNDRAIPVPIFPPTMEFPGWLTAWSSPIRKAISREFPRFFTFRNNNRNRRCRSDSSLRVGLCITRNIKERTRDQSNIFQNIQSSIHTNVSYAIHSLHHSRIISMRYLLSLIFVIFDWSILSQVIYMLFSTCWQGLPFKYEYLRKLIKLETQIRMTPP